MHAHAGRHGYTGTVRSSRWLKTCVAIWFLSLCISFPSNAQYYNLSFRNYLSFTGLAQSEVDAIFEDSRGFLWAGTHFGLSRYDGREFRNFYHHVDDSLSIADNEISSIDEDSKGTLWISLFMTGFCSFDTRTARFTNYTQTSTGKLPSKLVEALMVDKDDRIWLGTDKGLTVFNPTDGSFRNVSGPGEPAPILDVLCLVEDSLGYVWIGTRNSGIWRIDPELRQPLQIAGFDAVSEVRDIFLQKGHGVWIASSHGLFRLAEKAGSGYRVERARFFPQDESLVDVEVDARGNLWLATQVRGVAIYFPKTGFLDRLQENFSSPRGLLSNRMFELYQDSQDGMWLGGENGLQYFQQASQKFSIYPGLSSMSDLMRGSTLYGIAEVDNDLIMASSGGILVYNRVSNKYVPINYPPDYKPGSIRFRSLKREGPQVWWVSSDKGIFLLTSAKGAYTVSRPPQLKGINIFTSGSFRKYLKKGDDYYFALSNAGFLHWNQRTGQCIQHRHIKDQEISLGDDNLNQVEFDRDGNILIGHNEGLSIFYPASGTFRNFRARKDMHAQGLNSQFVYDMYDDGTYYWLATFGGGINRLHKASGLVEHYTTRNGLCNDGIYTLMPEGDSILWLGTAKGLARFNIRRQSFVNYGLEDGLPADEFNMLSRFVNDEGEIFMGTMNGLVSFSGSEIRKSNIEPRIYLSRIRLNGVRQSDSAVSTVNTSRRLITNYGEGVYMEFSSLVFNGSGNLGIRYRINEIDTAWRTGESGTLVPLIRTEPGVYTVSIQIYRNPGMEKSPEWTMQFIVKPPYWKTLPFRLIVVTLALLSVLLLVRSYISRRLQKQKASFEQEQAVEKERARISAELHDDIGGGLTAIRLMSEMLLANAREEKSKVYVSKISTSSNELIQKMNEIVWALNINNDNLQSLVSYTREFTVSYLDDVELVCRVDIPDQVPNVHISGTNRREIFLLVKESLNNIVKHAQASEVHLLVEIDGRLRIRIQDNGRGFDPMKVRSGANGLSNMQKRIKRLNGRMEIRSDRGTDILFDIPLQSLAHTGLA
jgi:signal transduction histidine kinase/ligand-binding sensor domain-containing protein